MERSELQVRIEEIEREIAELPPGSITTKTVGGKKYFYHRVTQNKKRTETYVSFDEVEELRSKIEKRRLLETELKKLKRMIPAVKPIEKEAPAYIFSTYTRIGTQLKKLAEPVRKYKKRECYEKLHDYVFGEQQDKVFILYGLRRTGKTTLIRQILLDMTEEQLQRSAFIQIKASNTLSDIN